MFHLFVYAIICLKFSEAGKKCPYEMVPIEGAKPDTCYTLRDPADGTFHMEDADEYCYEAYPYMMYLPTPTTRQQLAAIVRWAKPQIYTSHNQISGCC